MPQIGRIPEVKFMILWKVKIKLDLQMSAAEDYTAIKGGKLFWYTNGTRSRTTDGLRMALWGELVPHCHDICISCEHEAHPGAQW